MADTPAHAACGASATPSPAASTVRWDSGAHGSRVRTSVAQASNLAFVRCSWHRRTVARRVGSQAMPQSRNASVRVPHAPARPSASGTNAHSRAVVAHKRARAIFLARTTPTSLTCGPDVRRVKSERATQSPARTIACWSRGLHSASAHAPVAVARSRARAMCIDMQRALARGALARSAKQSCAIRENAQSTARCRRGSRGRIAAPRAAEARAHAAAASSPAPHLVAWSVLSQLISRRKHVICALALCTAPLAAGAAGNLLPVQSCATASKLPGVAWTYRPRMVVARALL